MRDRVGDLLLNPSMKSGRCCQPSDLPYSRRKHRTGVAFVNTFRAAEIAAVQLLWLGNGFWWMECLAMWLGASAGVLLFHLQVGLRLEAG